LQTRRTDSVGGTRFCTWLARRARPKCHDPNDIQRLAALPGRRGHPPCGDGGLLDFKGGQMYLILVVIMAGLGFGYVQVRRRRKSGSAKAA